MNPRIMGFAALLAGAWAVPAWAQPLDMTKGGPIDVTAQDGMEWRQNEQQVIARGDARAVRGDVTVTADRLTAFYRKKAPVAGAATPASAKPPSATESDTGQNEIYRLEADGHVKIFTATDLATGDRAIYDIDKAVLVMTGKAMSVTTPQQVLTARDTMEYWPQKHMAVGRGDATVVTSDGRRVTGDVLVAFTQPDQPGAPGKAPPAAPGGKAADPLMASGKLQRVEGFGNVEIRTANETIRGDRGVYVADSGIARLLGHVRITRGQNQLQGDEALVNMRTGISTLVRAPGKRVEGLVIPNDTGLGKKGDKPSTPTPKP